MKKPKFSNLSDHDVESLSSNLNNKKIALLVTGGIAAIKAPLLCRVLRKHGADVTVYTSDEALKYTTIDSLEWCSENKVISALSPQSEHLSGKNAFDLYLVAPATYNTINKFAQGIADNLITSTLAAALGKMELGKTKILLAPTMHGDLHNSILDESILSLEKRGVSVIPPRDAYGKHNLPDLETIVAYVTKELSLQPLKGTKVLVTGGPTPVVLDDVRKITNKFRGTLGLNVAQELFYQGADVHFIYGTGAGLSVPGYITGYPIGDYDQYKANVQSIIQNQKPEFGIFAAAVADYKPIKKFEGKIPSGKKELSIELEPTEKIVDLAKELDTNLKIISFKLESNISKDQLFEISKKRLNKGHLAVIANLLSEYKETGDHIAYLITNDPTSGQQIIGKDQIAKAITSLIISNK